MLKDCTSISGQLSIERSRFIETLTLPNLVSVGDDLRFQDNTELQHYTLPNLASIGDGFVMMGNPALVSFELPNLSNITGLLLVTNNNTLPTCLVDPVFLEQLNGAPDNTVVNGNRDACTCEAGDAGMLTVSCENTDASE